MPIDATPGSPSRSVYSGDLPAFAEPAAAEIGAELAEAIAPGLQLLHPIVQSSNE